MLYLWLKVHNNGHNGPVTQRSGIWHTSHTFTEILKLFSFKWSRITTGNSQRMPGGSR